MPSSALSSHPVSEAENNNKHASSLPTEIHTCTGKVYVEWELQASVMLLSQLPFSIQLSTMFTVVALD